jgi:murein L,D-transpeptidase YcbB/YkuD
MVFIDPERWPKDILPGTARAPAPKPPPANLTPAQLASYRQAAAFTASLAAAQPQANHFELRFQAAAEQYTRDWGNLPQEILPRGSSFRLGASGARTQGLRRRLGLAEGRDFDAELAEKVRRYKRAHGLGDNAVADNRLINSLNLGASHYLRTIAVNLARAQEIPINPGKRYLLVDTASQTLHMYEGKQAVDRMKVVVGKPSDPTPMMAALVSYSVLNPYWNVPPDLTRDRYAARAINGGPRYLSTRGFEALSDWTANPRVLSYDEVDWQAVSAGETVLRLRQNPGPGNGMGDIKFMFPNPLGIYLHDTPSRQLFAEDERAFSAGCVRVERAWDLARWLYGTAPVAEQGAAEQQVVMPEPVPIYITYFTALPVELGSGDFGFTFREDIYNRDAGAKLAALPEPEPVRASVSAPSLDYADGLN